MDFKNRKILQIVLFVIILSFLPVFSVSLDCSRLEDAHIQSAHDFLALNIGGHT